MIMRASIRLSIACRDAATARTLFTVLSPDNRAFPKDQRFTAGMKGMTLVFQAESERPMSVVSTIESILSDAGLFEAVWLLSSR
jgi:hypothetical protein